MGLYRRVVIYFRLNRWVVLNTMTPSLIDNAYKWFNITWFGSGKSVQRKETRNPSIYNIIRWFVGLMRQTTLQPSVWLTSPLSHRTSEPTYYFAYWRILPLHFLISTQVLRRFFYSFWQQEHQKHQRQINYGLKNSFLCSWTSMFCLLFMFCFLQSDTIKVGSRFVLWRKSIELKRTE